MFRYVLSVLMRWFIRNFLPEWHYCLQITPYSKKVKEAAEGKTVLQCLAFMRSMSVPGLVVPGVVSPDELLDGAQGDSTDLSCLLASMLIANKVKNVWAVEGLIDFEEDEGTFRHGWVEVEGKILDASDFGGKKVRYLPRVKFTDIWLKKVAV